MRKQRISQCAGWNYVMHPTNRKLTSVTAYSGTAEATTLALCPDCLASFTRDELLKLQSRKKITEAPNDEISGS